MPTGYQFALTRPLNGMPAGAFVEMFVGDDHRLHVTGPDLAPVRDFDLAALAPMTDDARELLNALVAVAEALIVA